MLPAHAPSPHVFSAHNTRMQVLEGNLEKKAGVNYAPPAGKQLVIHVDDLNAPRSGRRPLCVLSAASVRQRPAHALTLMQSL